jgi:hypothetical protein
MVSMMILSRWHCSSEVVAYGSWVAVPANQSLEPTRLSSRLLRFLMHL